MYMYEKELEILTRLHQDTNLHQRDLSRVVGLSLGMTNAILKRLATKGYLMVRKVNNRNIKYVVSPAGVEEISKRGYHYFKRTIKNIVNYKESLRGLLQEVKGRGVERIVLEGESDVDFIIEHLCAKTGLQFTRASAGYVAGANELVLVSEVEDPLQHALKHPGGESGMTQAVPSEGRRQGPFPSIGRAEPRVTDASAPNRVYLRKLLIPL